jgi:hypothetical protein
MASSANVRGSTMMMRSLYLEWPDLELPGWKTPFPLSGLRRNEPENSLPPSTDNG